VPPDADESIAHPPRTRLKSATIIRPFMVGRPFPSQAFLAKPTEDRPTVEGD
jgi:hypothetical protein